MTRCSGSLLAAVTVALTVPAVTIAGPVYETGPYRGMSEQRHAVSFTVADGAVRDFRLRVRLRCPDGRRPVVRVFVPLISTLDRTTGEFRHARGTRLRVKGRLSGMAGTGTVLRRNGACRSGSREWVAEHEH